MCPGADKTRRANIKSIPPCLRQTLTTDLVAEERPPPPVDGITGLHAQESDVESILQSAL